MASSNRWRLTPREAEEILKEEFKQRRIDRIRQVRQQSKEIAASVLNKVQTKKEKEVNKIKEEVKTEHASQVSKQQQMLESQYQAQLEEVGKSHKSAEEMKTFEDRKAKLAAQQSAAARARGKDAISTFRKEMEDRKEKATATQESRKAALEVERQRSSKISALPPPLKDPVEELLKQKVSQGKNPEIVPSSKLSLELVLRNQKPSFSKVAGIEGAKQSKEKEIWQDSTSKGDVPKECKRETEQQFVAKGFDHFSTRHVPHVSVVSVDNAEPQNKPLHEIKEYEDSPFQYEEVQENQAVRALMRGDEAWKKEMMRKNALKLLDYLDRMENSPKQSLKMAKENVRPNRRVIIEPKAAESESDIFPKVTKDVPRVLTETTNVSSSISSYNHNPFPDVISSNMITGIEKEKSSVAPPVVQVTKFYPQNNKAPVVTTTPGDPSPVSSSEVKSCLSELTSVSSRTSYYNLPEGHGQPQFAVRPKPTFQTYLQSLEKWYEQHSPSLKARESIEDAEKSYATLSPATIDSNVSELEPVLEKASAATLKDSTLFNEGSVTEAVSSPTSLDTAFMRNEASQLDSALCSSIFQKLSESSLPKDTSEKEELRLNDEADSNPSGWSEDDCSSPVRDYSNIAPECLHNFLHPRPPVSYRIVNNEVLVPHQLSTIEEMDTPISLATSSSTLSSLSKGSRKRTEASGKESSSFGDNSPSSAETSELGVTEKSSGKTGTTEKSFEKTVTSAKSLDKSKDLEQMFQQLEDGIKTFENKLKCEPATSQLPAVKFPDSGKKKNRLPEVSCNEPLLMDEPEPTLVGSEYSTILEKPVTFQRSHLVEAKAKSQYLQEWLLKQQMPAPENSLDTSFTDSLISFMKHEQSYMASDI